MALMRGIKRQVGNVAPAVIFLGLTGYFGWSATRGDLGLQAYSRRRADLVDAQNSLAAAQSERDTWQQRVTALQPTHLDRDALDERARALLNLAAPDEIVVPTNDAKPPH